MDPTAVKRSDLPFLDGVRGLAAVIVLLSHASLAGYLQLGGIGLGGIGKSGVYLFFLLSAYLLTRVILENPDRFWTPAGVAQYALRRGFRIYPLFAAYLLISLVGTWMSLRLFGEVKGLPFAVDGQVLLDHLLLREGLGVTWSIAVEFKFYLILPVLALAFGQAARVSGLLALALLAVICALTGLVWPASEAMPNDTNTFRYLQVFAMGCFLAGWERGLAGARPGPVWLFTALFILACLAWLCLVPDIAKRLFGETIDTGALRRAYLPFALIWAAFTMGLAYGAPILRRPFEHRAARYVGLVSFSLYLWHPLVIEAYGPVAHLLPKGLGWLPILVAALALAHVSYLLFERPFLKLGSSRRNAPPKPGPTSVDYAR